MGDCVDSETISEWYNTGIMRNAEDLERFVEDNYSTVFDWGVFDKSEDVKKALFARLIFNLYLHFKVNHEGMIVKDMDLFNGRIFIPRKIIGNEIVAIKSNYFSRFAFINSVKGIKANQEKLLIKYKDTLIKFDEKQELLLGNLFEIRNSENHLLINKLLSKSWIVFSLTAIVLIRTKDGYVYSTRGDMVMGFGRYTLMTGIVDRTNINEVIKTELLEEFGIKDGVKELRHLGTTLIDQHSEARRVAVLGLLYLVDIDIDEKTFVEGHKTAVDRYENDSVFFTKKQGEDLKEFLSELNPKSITLEALTENL